MTSRLRAVNCTLKTLHKNLNLEIFIAATLHKFPRKIKHSNVIINDLLKKSTIFCLCWNTTKCLQTSHNIEYEMSFIQETLQIGSNRAILHVCSWNKHWNKRANHTNRNRKVCNAVQEKLWKHSTLWFFFLLNKMI